MNITLIKTFLCLMLMIIFVIMAIITKDIINSKLFASLGLITGTIAFSSPPDTDIIEE
jgi:hypothetical protein